MASKSKQETEKINREEIIENPDFIGETNEDVDCSQDCTYLGLEDVAEAIEEMSGAIVPWKLYHSLGQNTDGPVAQNVVTDALDEKLDKDYLTGGEEGESLVRASTEIDYTYEYVTLVPKRGSTGQVLTKRSNSDYDTYWADGGGGGTEHGIPAGGTTGQALIKGSDADYDADWSDIEGALPAGGMQGQVLKKKSNTSLDVEWGNVEGELPAGGTTNQVLAKNSNRDGDVKWINQSGGSTVKLIEYPYVDEWEEQQEQTVSDYPFRGKIIVDGIDADWGVFVNFSEKDADVNRFAVTTETDTNCVYIYAKEIPTETTGLTINSIYLFNE